LKYRAEIDGLRALAVVPVILFHAGFELFGGGYVGVDVFFVISGYLITTIIIDDLGDGNFSLIRFYERRARRILPALFFVVLACIPMAWIWLLPDDLESFAKSVAAVATFSSNILFWRESGYFAAPAVLMPLLHTWSLAVEEQYYIIYPLMLMLVWPMGRRAMLGLFALLFALSLGLAQWGAFNFPAATFFLLPTRGWELLIGAFAAFYLQRNSITWSASWQNVLGIAGAAMILVSVFVFDETTPFPSLYALLPTVGAVLIILFAVQGTLVNRILAIRPLVGMGLVSYSAYLWHQPLFAFARYRLTTEPSSATMAMLALASFGLAYLTWKYVENPFRSRQLINAPSIFTVAAVCAALFVAAGYFGYVAEGFPSRISERSLMAYDVDITTDNNPCNFEDKVPSADDEIFNRCYHANNSVYLIGDSHAMALSKSMREVLAENNINLISLNYIRCLPIPGTSRRPFQKGCVVFKDDLVKLIRARPAPVIISSRWRFNLEGNTYDNGDGGNEYLGYSGKNYVVGDEGADIFEYTLKQIALISEITNLVIIDQIPEAGWNVPETLLKRKWYRNGLERKPLATSYDRYREANGRVIALFEDIGRLKNVKVVETAPIVCSDSIRKCVNELDGVPLYIDSNHPTPQFARIISEKVMRTLGKSI
jgi:peptidoglycan/LPS O-acetylase OafA/YrhL